MEYAVSKKEDPQKSVGLKSVGFVVYQRSQERT